MSTRTAVRITVTGRVQGVGFRMFVQRHAAALRLDGWVRNRRDGSVEIMASGEPRQVDQLVERATTGPALAKVEEITVRAAEDDGTVGFDERPTL